MAQAPAAPVARPAEAPEPTPPFPAAAARFVRAEHLQPGYAAGRHIALTLTLAGTIAAGAALMAVHARPIDWLVGPAFFLVANFVEWAVHRYPMHHPMKPRILYKNHTLIHHIAFTDRNMPITRSAELGLVMMPWYTMIGLFAVASPVMIVAGVLRGVGLSGVFLLAAVAYFLMYEVLHASGR